MFPRFFYIGPTPALGLMLYSNQSSSAPRRDLVSQLNSTGGVIWQTVGSNFAFESWLLKAYIYSCSIHRKFGDFRLFTENLGFWASHSLFFKLFIILKNSQLTPLFWNYSFSYYCSKAEDFQFYKDLLPKDNLFQENTVDHLIRKFIFAIHCLPESYSWK